MATASAITPMSGAIILFPRYLRLNNRLKPCGKTRNVTKVPKAQSLGGKPRARRSVEVFHKDDFVVLFVVEQLIHAGPYHDQAKPSGAQSLLRSDIAVSHGLVSISDSGVVEFRELEPWPRISYPVHNHALSSEVGNSNLAPGVQFTTPLNRIHEQFMEGLPDGNACLLRQPRFQMGHESFQALRRLQRTRNCQFDPIR